MAFTIRYGGDEDLLLSVFLGALAARQTYRPGWYLELDLREELPDGRRCLEGHLRAFHGTGPDDPERGDDVVVLAVADPVTALPTGEVLRVPVGSIYGVVVP